MGNIGPTELLLIMLVLGGFMTFLVLLVVLIVRLTRK